MFRSAHSRRLASMTAITTMALTASLLIAGASTINAQWAIRTGAVEAATSSPTVRPGQAGTPNAKALVGSWMETVTFPAASGRPPLKSLGSFHDGGTYTYADQGNVLTLPPLVFSAGHGVWTHREHRTFAYTSFGLISDLNGNLVGYLKARGIYTVSASGNEYSGTTHVQILDADGNVLESITVTNEGRRIIMELP